MNRQIVTIPAAEVERLAALYGPRVRSAGKWSREGDGSVEVPMYHVTLAVQTLGDWTLAEALEHLRDPKAHADQAAAAEKLIDTLADLYIEQFQQRVERFQGSDDPEEVERLRQEISRELFGA